MALIPYINDYSKAVNEFGQTAEFVGVTENPSSGSSSIPVVYGQRRVDGVRFWNYVPATDSTTLYCAYALSEDWCQGMTQLFVDGNLVNLAPDSFTHSVPHSVTQGIYAGILEVEFIDGRNTYSNYGSLSPSPGTSTILRRDLNVNLPWNALCYIVCKFKYVVGGPYTQMPQITVDLSGRKIQPWDGTTGAFYTDNPAYIIWDLMSNKTYGRGLTNSSIDSASFTAVYNSCNTARQKILPAASVMKCNWICSTDNSVLNNIKTVLETFQLNLSFIQNKWVLTAESDPNTSTLTFNETNIVDSVQIQYPNIGERFNRVIIDYIEPTNNFQSQATQFPAIGTNTYLDEDAGLILEKRIQLNQITSAVVANDIAQMTLLRSRNQVTYRFRATKEAHQVRVGDLVTINTVIPYISNQSAIVINQTLNSDYTFDMECVSYTSTHYPKSFTNSVSIPTGTGGGNTAPPPVVVPTSSYSITSTRDASSFNIFEGQSIVWTINTLNVPDGTNVTWTITGTCTSADFTVAAMSGTLTVNSNTATFSKTTSSPNTRNGPRTIVFRIFAAGVQVAEHNVTLLDPGATPVSAAITWTYTNALTLEDNTNYYLGFMKTDNTFDYDKSRSASVTTVGSTASQKGYQAKVTNKNGVITYELWLGLIDRLADNQALNKNIYISYSSGNMAGAPAPFGYWRQQSSPLTAINGSEWWQYDPENPPQKLTNSKIAMLRGGVRYLGGATTIGEYVDANTLDYSAGAIQLVKQKNGQYISNNPIRFTISGFGTNGFWPLTSGNGSFFNGLSWDNIVASTGIPITIKFFEVNAAATGGPIIYIGKKTFNLTLNTAGMTYSDVVESRTAWASRGWTAIF